MTNPRLLVLVAALAAMAPALPAAAQQPAAPAPAAAPTKEAQAEAAVRYKKGVDLFNEGDFQAALIEFRRAYELAPNYAVLYNIGQVYFQLQDYAHALTTLEQYLGEGGKNVAAGRRSEVEKDIEKLKSRVANIEITVNVPDAEIAIDDISVGKSPLQKPVLVSAGRHKVTVTKVGFTSTSKVVEIASADLQKVGLELIETGKTGPVPPVGPEVPPNNPGGNTGQGPQNPVTPPQPPGGGPDVPQLPPPPPKSSPVWLGWAVTGALAVGAAVCGGLALSASSDLGSLKKSPDATRADLDSNKSKAQTLAGVSDALSAGAIVAGGITLYFTIKGASAASDANGKGAPAAPAPAAAPAGKGAFAPVVKLGVGPSGVRVVGAF